MQIILSLPNLGSHESALEHLVQSDRKFKYEALLVVFIFFYIYRMCKTEQAVHLQNFRELTHACG